MLAGFRWNREVTGAVTTGDVTGAGVEPLTPAIGNPLVSWEPRRKIATFPRQDWRLVHGREGSRDHQLAFLFEEELPGGRRPVGILHRLGPDPVALA